MMQAQPLISICHASARPLQWRSSYDAWLNSCDHPEQIEYILSVDQRWGFNPLDPPELGERSRVVWCREKRGAITAWNEAAFHARGKILIANSDDMRPPQHWDTLLLESISDLDAEFVVEVSSGPLADDRRLMVIYILSRARYDRLGYIVNPQYLNVYTDNEFTDHARLDNIVIDARHLIFQHHHPDQGNGLFERDAAYLSGNTREGAVQGRALFTQRKAAGFPPISRPQRSSLPSVSVITPTVPERSSLLSQARASVASQTHPHIEHLVGLDSPKIGPAARRNSLVARSTSDWLVFLDDDDLLDPTFVELHLAHALATSSDIVYSLCRYPPKSKTHPPITEFDASRLLRSNYIPMTTLVRREAFDKVHGFSPTARLEDYQLWLDLLKSGATFSFLPLVLWTCRPDGNPWTPPQPCL